MAASGTTSLVLAGFAGNACIAVAKLAAAAWTGSAALLAEGVHSIAATTSQALLWLGLGRASRRVDEAHSVGQARELYFWSFVVATLLYSLGAGVAIYEGIDKLQRPRALIDPGLTYAVLAVALVFQAGMAWQGLRVLSGREGRQGLRSGRHGATQPAAFTMLLESLAGLAGALMALAGLALTHLRGWSEGDAAASIAVGLLLGAVAARMAIETKGRLVDAATSPDMPRERPSVMSPHGARPGTTAASGDPEAASETASEPLVPDLVLAEMSQASRGAAEVPKKNYPPPKPGKGKKKRR